MKRSTVKELCEKLAYVYFALGLVGSFILASKLGKKVDYVYSSGRVSYERDWKITIAVFAGCLISILIVSLLLLALSYTLSSFETLEYKIGSLEDTIDEMNKGNSKQNDNKVIKGNQWKCTSCGRVNQSYETTCLCGNPKA